MSPQVKKILLIYPKNFAVSALEMFDIEDIVRKRGGWLNASLATIAALTPPDFEIRIIDENVETVDFSVSYDIVGITGHPTQLERAREIATAFAPQKALIVCGGPSVALSPEKWKPFSDVLIIGEAERIWPQFLMDYLARAHRSEYREEERFDLALSPLPDYRCFNPALLDQYIGGIVQTSRGCPFNCEFCTVIAYNGRKLRYKKPERVIAEIEQLAKLGYHSIFVVDDNFCASRQDSKAILRAIRDWNQHQKYPLAFMTQVSLDIAEDDEFLELAAEAGFTKISIGFESANLDSLKEAGKISNLRGNMVESVRRIQEYGIMTIGTIVFGFDHDDLSIFQKQFDFCQAAGIPSLSIYILDARDGTALKERMIKEQRYIEASSLEKKGINTLTVRSIIPKQMTSDQLLQGAFWTLSKLYHFPNLIERLEVFMENYERSTRKHKLKIPKYRVDREGIAIVWRMVIYVLRRAPWEEKRAFWRLLKIIGRFSHPQKLYLLFGTFLAGVHLRRMMYKLNPEIHEVKYPE